MKKLLFILIFASFICVSCAAFVTPYGTSIGIAPPLPFAVELEGPYYAYHGYHYYYDHDRWYYSRSRRGPWRDLPRDRYPKEIRYKDKRYDSDWRYRRGWGDDRDSRH